MDFAVTTVPRARDLVLQVTGELDIATVKQLRAAVGSALDATPGRLLVDLTGTAFIDSTGCSELVRTAKAGGRASVPVEVVVPPGNWKVRRVVDFVQLAEIVPVHDEVPAP